MFGNSKNPLSPLIVKNICTEYLPNNKDDKRGNPQDALILLEFGSNRSRQISRGSISLANPSKLGPDQKDKSQKKPGKKSSNMGKVVHMRENPNC